MSASSIQVSQVFEPFSAEEVWALRRFSRKVDELNSSAFAKSETKLNAAMIPGESIFGGPAFQVEVEGPSEEQVKAVVGDFRQLYTGSNPTSAFRVMNILKANAKSRGAPEGHAVIAALRMLAKRVERRKIHDPRGVFLEETELGKSEEKTPAEIIAIWLNGQYLHDDVDLAAELDPPGHMSTEMMQMSLQMAIRDFIAYWTALQSLVAVVLADETLAGADPQMAS